jgi:transmembrane 9 superfamily protein 2/4
MARPSLPWVVVLGCLLAMSSVHGFILRGVMPNTYRSDDEIQLKVNSLTSVSKILPFDWYSLPWCQVTAEERKKYRRKRNLGEILWGDQIEPSLYRVHTLKNITCAEVCTVSMTPKDVELLSLGYC